MVRQFGCSIVVLANSIWNFQILVENSSKLFVLCPFHDVGSTIYVAEGGNRVGEDTKIMQESQVSVGF